MPCQALQKAADAFDSPASPRCLTASKALAFEEGASRFAAVMDGRRIASFLFDLGLEAVLTAVRLVGDHDDVAAVGQNRIVGRAWFWCDASLSRGAMEETICAENDIAFDASVSEIPKADKSPSLSVQQPRASIRFTSIASATKAS